MGSYALYSLQGLIPSLSVNRLVCQACRLSLQEWSVVVAIGPVSLAE